MLATWQHRARHSCWAEGRGQIKLCADPSRPFHLLARTCDGGHDGGKLGEELDEGVDAVHDARQQRHHQVAAVARAVPRLRVSGVFGY